MWTVQSVALYLGIAALMGRYITSAFSPRSSLIHRSRSRTLLRDKDESRTTDTEQQDSEVVDVIVIGAGVGGLTCAALSARYGYSTLCLEAHDRPGGVAHSFTRYSTASKVVPFTFDSGPSLISGLSSKSTNPLRQVLDALDVADTVHWKVYDGWLVHDWADGTSFKITTGDGGEWEAAIEKKAGKLSREAFVHFRDKLLEHRGLSEASTYVPPFALRDGISSVRSLSNYLFKLISIGTKGTLLTGPFSKVMDLYGVRDTFVRRWFDYLAFALSGLDAAHTQAAALAYMMIDLHKQGAVLDYPMGGMDSLIQALVRGLVKYGGTLQVNSRVDRLLLEERNGRAECHGVVLADGRKVMAKHGVVCNAPLWNMARIVEDSVTPELRPVEAVTRAADEIRQQANRMCMTGSFMHLHLGIPSDGLPADLECHHSVLDFDKPITDEQNMVIISIPTVFDPSLAPDGYHVVHAYTAACDSFEDWEPFLDGGVDLGKVGLSPNSAAASKYAASERYRTLKEQKAEVLWQAVERVIPDVRKRVKQKGSIVLIGTPLTHRRYNQRFRGTYGPSNSPGKDVWELPGATTRIKGLLACGDTTFPGKSRHALVFVWCSNCKLYLTQLFFDEIDRYWSPRSRSFGDHCSKLFGYCKSAE
jgi:phytoene dehydrogenase-like protein